MRVDPILEARGLKKHFPVAGSLPWTEQHVVKAVDGVSFSIAKGETLALVGESGCGKTTTAHMVLRLQEPSDGTLLLDGQQIQSTKGKGLRSFRRKIQAVFQDPWSSLNPRMRVGDIVAEPLIVNGDFSRSEIEEKVRAVLNEVGLRPELAGNYPHEFSGGQRQRIAIAAALISEPELIVLDEPVSALDVSIRSQILNLFLEIQAARNVSYIFVSHDLATTRYFSTHVAVMYLGKVVEYGPTRSVFEQPRHPYTRALLASVLPMHPDDADNGFELSGEIPSPLSPPPGCAFHGRCPQKIGDACERMVPELMGQVDGTSVACHLYPVGTHIDTLETKSEGENA